jgi:hypothetical protein
MFPYKLMTIDSFPTIFVGYLLFHFIMLYLTKSHLDRMTPRSVAPRELWCWGQRGGDGVGENPRLRHHRCGGGWRHSVRRRDALLPVDVVATFGATLSVDTGFADTLLTKKIIFLKNKSSDRRHTAKQRPQKFHQFNIAWFITAITCL